MSPMPSWVLREAAAGPGHGASRREVSTSSSGTVGVDVGARESRGDEGRAQARTAGVELVDESVLGLAQRGQRNRGAEIGGIFRAAVRRIEDDGHGRANGFDAEEGGMCLHGASFRWQAERWPGEISRSLGASAWQRAVECGHLGWKWHPPGGSSGEGISPLIGM